MASWVIHFRVADMLLDKLWGLCPLEFIFGNLAPDSGVPNEDWSDFCPSPVVSHFKTIGEDGRHHTNAEKFANEYLSADKIIEYSEKKKSFYFGYLSHLLTDMLWTRNTFPICIANAPDEYEAVGEALVWTWKKDFYDIDSLYLKNNPQFRAFELYKNAVGFENEFLSIFSKDAFDKKREVISSFYDINRNDLGRKYKYFTEKDSDDFVRNAVEEIYAKIIGYYET